MAIDITIDGILYQGATDYTVIEDSTPTNPADNSGGVGQITFTLPAQDNQKRFRDKVVTLTDGTQGTTTGTARGISGDDSTVTVTADSRLGALNVTRTAAPYTGTLGGAFRYYLGLVSITTGIVVDPTLESIPVTVSGWSALVWDQMKKMCTAYGAEISLVSDNVVLRPTRQRIAVLDRDSTRAWAQDATSLAQSVEVYYYQSSQQTNALAYPLGGWNTAVQVYTVDAGKTEVITIPLTPQSGTEGLIASITSVQQPVAVDSVDRNYASSSVYSITGNDGLPYLSAQWVAGGGSVTVAIGADTRSLIVTIVAPAATQYAPYTLAMSAGPSNMYSSLRIVGTGVFSNRKLLTMPTGVTPDRAPQVIGASVDNEFINTYSDAWHAAIRAAGSFASAKQTITVTTTGINRLDDNGSAAYPTVSDANAEFAGMTVGAVNAMFAGQTVAQFNAHELSLVSSDFENQAFGNIGGALVEDGEAIYRIRTVPQIQAGSLNYTAEMDITIADANAVFAGWTVAQINALHAGETVSDFNSAPLRTV